VSVSYFVRYDISAPDLPAFLERYREVHLPLVSTWPGLQRVVMHSGNAVLMQFEFDTEKAMNEALKKFIQFEGSVVQEAMRAEEVWRSPWLDANEEQA
jgi:hypothetical protein